MKEKEITRCVRFSAGSGDVAGAGEAVVFPNHHRNATGSEQEVQTRLEEWLGFLLSLGAGSG